MIWRKTSNNRHNNGNYEDHFWSKTNKQAKSTFVFVNGNEQTSNQQANKCEVSSLLAANLVLKKHTVFPWQPSVNFVWGNWSSVFMLLVYVIQFWLRYFLLLCMYKYMYICISELLCGCGCGCFTLDWWWFMPDKLQQPFISSQGTHSQNTFSPIN